MVVINMMMIALACVSNVVVGRKLRLVRQLDSNSVDFPEIKLVASDGAEADRFGASVSFSGNSLAVGAPGDSETIGSLYMFENMDGDWKQTAKIVPKDGQTFDFFATSVAVDGKTVVAGAFLDDDNDMVNSGSVYVFENDGSDYPQTAKLTASDSMNGDQFGRPVAISGDAIAVGAGLNDSRGINAGAVYIFERVDSNWVETAKLTASDASNLALFGTALDLQDGTLVVGAFGATNDNGDKTGAAYVFQKASSGWSEKQKLVAKSGSNGDNFGASVSIAGSTIVVGASGSANAGPGSGAVYVFESDEGEVYQETATLTASDGFSGDRFGGVVDNIEDTIVIGASSTDENGSATGSVYIFRKDNKDWVEASKLNAKDGNAGDFFGSSVGVTHDYIASGALFASNDGADTGAVYVTANQGELQQNRTCLPRVVSFTVFDPIMGFTEDLPRIIDLNKYHDGELNIEAGVEDCGENSNIQCVRLELGSHKQIERIPPYTLFSYRGAPDIGSQVLKACVYPRKECRGEPTSCREVETTIVECTKNVTRLVVYDAKDDVPIADVEEGGEICLPKGGEVNFEAVATGCVGSVVLKLQGGDKTDHRIERAAPYFLYGNDGKEVFGRGGFKEGVPYTLAAYPEGEDSVFERTFRFRTGC